MQLQKAMSQISEIHAQLSKAEVFRGYRAWPLATTGAIALLAAIVQANWLPAADAVEFASFWLVCAAVCALICGSDLVVGLRREPNASERRRSLNAVGQFFPAILVGTVVTAALLRSEPAAGLLPGLWALFFALGLFSSRLHLPRAVGWVALWFVVGGSIQLWTASSPPSPWRMGLCFGCGHLALAWVFFTNLERGRHGR